MVGPAAFLKTEYDRGQCRGKELVLFIACPHGQALSLFYRRLYH